MRRGSDCRREVAEKAQKEVQKTCATELEESAEEKCGRNGKFGRNILPRVELQRLKIVKRDEQSFTCGTTGQNKSVVGCSVEVRQPLLIKGTYDNRKCNPVSCW